MEPRTKHFKKREAILNCLRSTTSHPTAEWVHAQLKAEYPDISLGTIYRNLALFKEQGLIISVGTVKGVERFDGNTDFHIHFICTECGAVLDLEGTPDLSGMRSGAEAELGSQIQGCQITYSGICRECLANHNKEEAV